MAADRAQPRRTNGSPIARIRLERGMTQGQLAKLVGCYTKDISHWETGKHSPRIDTLAKIASALNVSLDDLIQK